MKGNNMNLNGQDYTDATPILAPRFTTKDNLLLGLAAISPIAVSLLIVAIKPKTADEISMASLMISSTGIPFLSEIANRFRDADKPIISRQIVATISAALMAAAMVFMTRGAVKNMNESAITKDVFYSVMGFCMFTAINLVYNGLKLAGVIQDMPIAEFISNVLGFAGSTGFLAAQIMSYPKADHAGKVKAGLISGTAAGFMFVTFAHSVLAAQKMDVRTTAQTIVSGARAWLWSSQTGQDNSRDRQEQGARETDRLIP